MTKCPLARGYCYSCGGEWLKTAEDYGHDNLVENPPRFDFSIIDYPVMAGGQASKLDFVGAWVINES